MLKGHIITNPSYQDFSEKSLKRFHSLLVNLLATSSTVQRKTIIYKLRNYAKDFIAYLFQENKTQYRFNE